MCALKNTFNDDLNAFYQAIGFFVVQWGQAEQSLDLTINTLFSEPKFRGSLKKMPKMLTPKLDYLDKCAELEQFDSSLSELCNDLVQRFKTLKPLRDDLLHGAIEDLEHNNGIYSFAKLDTQSDHHIVREVEFDVMQFPEISKQLVDLGRVSIDVAQQIWDLYGNRND